MRGEFHAHVQARPPLPYYTATRLPCHTLEDALENTGPLEDTATECVINSSRAICDGGFQAHDVDARHV